MTPGPGQGTSKRRHLGPRYWSLANVSKAEKQKEAGVSREWPPRLQTITLSHRETDSDSRTGGEDQHISSFSHYCPLSLSFLEILHRHPHNWNSLNGYWSKFLSLSPFRQLYKIYSTWIVCTS